MPDDPANARARSRSRLGLSRELQQDRTSLGSDPSIGGTRGYPYWFRIRALAHAANHGVEHAAITWGCHVNSIKNWQARPIPYNMTGGSEREGLTGRDQLLLVICLFIYPHALADEICTFIVANGGDVYSRELITSRCNDLNITRKRVSKEAYDAFSPQALQKLERFQTLPPPLGVSGIDIWRLIDFDETGFYLSDRGGNYGRGYSCIRVRVPSHYTRAQRKVNVLCGVEAGNPKFHLTWMGHYNNHGDGCDQYNFGAFCNEVCSDIEQNPIPGGYDNSKVFMWDGLSVHNTPYVIQTIQGRPSNNAFRIVTRPPYRPKIAPIEYIFCELACELDKRIKRNWTIWDLRQNIIEILNSIGFDGKLNNTFRHCGYPM